MRTVERLDEGPLETGSRVRIRQPRLPVAVWTVTVLETGRYFEWQNLGPGLETVGGHRVRAENPVAVKLELATIGVGELAKSIAAARAGAGERLLCQHAILP